MELNEKIDKQLIVIKRMMDNKKNRKEILKQAKKLDKLLIEYLKDL